MFRFRWIDQTFSSAWWRFLRLWKPMAGWTLLNYLAAGVLIVPLLSFLLGLIVFRGDRVVVGNDELLRWLLNPIGIGYLLTAGGLAIAVNVVRYAGLFRILVDDLDGRPVSVRQTFVELIPDLPALLRLCVAAVAFGAMMILPLVAALALVYATVLGEFDINYYIAETPPEWRRALYIGGAVIFIWLPPAVYVGLRTLPSLPAFLDGYRPLRAALNESWFRTRGEAARALWLFALCVAAWIMTRIVLHGTYALLAVPAWRLLDGMVTSLTPLLLATVIWAAGTFVLDVTVSFIGFSLAATVLTKFYFEDTDLHQHSPPIPLGLRALPRHAARRLLWWLHPFRFVPTVAVVLFVSVGASAILLRPVTGEADFKVAAHRAGAFLGVENTLATLDRAIESSADYAEIDVQLTRDSVIVVVHDADMMRLAASPARIADTSAEDLLSLRLLAPDDAPPEELRIATLDEFLTRSRGRIGLMIELKYYGFDPALAPAVVEAVRRHEMEDEVIIISLNLQAVRQVRAIAPDLSTGFIGTVTAGDLSRLPVDMLAVARPLASPSLVRSARRQDIAVYVWTVNRVATMLAAVDRGVNGVITDDPALAVALRRELAALSAPERLILRLRNLLPDMDAYRSDADPMGGPSSPQVMGEVPGPP
jgi:glycerophosphoryl diester phosphodiesterase